MLSHRTLDKKMNELAKKERKDGEYSAKKNEKLKNKQEAAKERVARLAGA